MSAHVPDWMATPIDELLALARTCDIELRPHLRKHELVAALAADRLQRGEAITTEGLLAVLPEGFGFVRLLAADLEPGEADAYVSPSQVRALNLQPGSLVRGPIRAPKGNERFFALLQVEQVQGADVAELGAVAHFDAHDTFVPTRGWDLPEAPATPAALRSLCRGHRALLQTAEGRVPPRQLARLARALRGADAEVVVCLLDQRPEDVPAARAEAGADVTVMATPFAAEPERHVQLAEMALGAALRAAERGRDAVLLLDSLTALTRAVARSAAPSGRWACPGLDAAALLPAKRLFAAARQLAAGGSLTVVATLERAPGSAIDAAIADEFAPVANAIVEVEPARR